MRAVRTQKKDQNGPVGGAGAEPDYQEAVRQRFRVEQPFGLAKLWHGFGRCRYVGYLRYGAVVFHPVGVEREAAVKIIKG